MSFLRRVIGGERRSGVVSVVPGDLWRGGLHLPTNAGISVSPDSALAVTTIFACVGLLCDCIAMLPLILYKRLPKDSREPDTGNYLYDLLKNKPNRWQSSFEWRHMMAGHLLMRGNAYSRIVSVTRGIDVLIPLHPDRVEPFIAPDGTKCYQYQSESTGTIVLLQHEVMHWRGFGVDSRNPLKGLSPLQLHRESIAGALATQQHGNQLFSNGAQVGGVLKSPKQLSDAAYERLRTSWAERQAGVSNAHKPAILEDGLEWEKMALTAEESQFLETRSYTRIDLCSIYRVPPHMVSITDKATSWGTGLEQQSLGFVIYTLMPILTNIEQALERDVLTDKQRKDLFIKFMVQAMLRGDMAGRSTFYHNAILDGWMSRNEVRALEEMNNAGADLDKFLTPLNMTTDNGNNSGGNTNA